MLQVLDHDLHSVVALDALVSGGRVAFEDSRSLRQVGSGLVVLGRQFVENLLDLLLPHLHRLVQFLSVRNCRKDGRPIDG